MNKDFISKLKNASQYIHKQSLNVRSNYMIVSSEIAEVMSEVLDPVKMKQKDRLRKIKRILNEEDTNMSDSDNV